MPGNQQPNGAIVPRSSSSAATPATTSTCCNQYCLLINGTVFLWSITNNLPLNFNSINQSLKRLGLLKQALTGTINTPAGIAVNVVIGTSFVIFAIGNQRTFTQDLKTVFRISDAGSCLVRETSAESCGWIAVDAISGIAKALARIASSAVFAYRFAGSDAAIASLPFTTIASLIANLGYFSKRAEFTGLTCLSPLAKKLLRYFSNITYSLSTSILYFESLNALLPHLAESHLGSDTDPMTSHDEWYFDLINIVNALGALTVLLATMGKFNQRIAGFLAEQPTESALPICLQRISSHSAVVAIAAIDKALIGAGSAFALFFSIGTLLNTDLDTNLSITAILVVLGLISSLFVQYAQLAPDPTQVVTPITAASEIDASIDDIAAKDKRLDAAEGGRAVRSVLDGDRRAELSAPLMGRLPRTTRGRTNPCSRISQLCCGCWSSLFGSSSSTDSSSATDEISETKMPAFR